MATINGYTETAQGYQANGNNTRVNAAASPPKQPHPPEKNVNSQSVLKRLIWVFFFFFNLPWLKISLLSLCEYCFSIFELGLLGFVRFLILFPVLLLL
jgi:hypothetical protein